MTDELTRLDALRALLAAHQPVEDDARGGHTYRWPTAAHTVRLKGKTPRAKKLVGRVMSLAGWRTA